jgi:DNA-binding ferritin-like protein (Dps family)
MITNIKQLKSLLENNISPLRFKESSLDDIIDFVDELLYDLEKTFWDILEKGDY